jgi:CRP-like cAMP-binding protein
MNRFEVHLTVRETSGCPVYEDDEEVRFVFPRITTSSARGVCAHLVHALHPQALALHLGASLEETDLARFEESGYPCPGCKGDARARFEIQLKKAAAPTLTGVITQKDKDVLFIVDHLKRIPLFEPLPQPSIRKLINVLELKRFEDRTDVIVQGTEGKFLYIIIKGEVEVLQRGPDGRESLLATLRKGECFGEMSLISGEPVSATVRADGPLSALTISRENFQKILTENNSLNIYFNRLLTQRLRRQNVQIEEELAKGVLGKLSMISLPELAQTLNMNNRTGTLHLYNADLRGEIFFVDGNAIDAKLGETEGEDAFYELLTWNEGDFRFKPGDPSREKKIGMDTMGLLMEGLRRIDEASKAAS